MATTPLPEHWMRGPVPGIAPYLQPAAHALLQARDEVNELMKGFPENRLWEKPAGVASPGFHLQHLTGVLDRLFTYAKGQALSPEQLQRLKSEGTPSTEAEGLDRLLHNFNQQVDHALAQLRATPEASLTEFRGVGRAQLPSTVLGLLMHAAEHSMRHVGQLLVTVRILKAAQS